MKNNNSRHSKESWFFIITLGLLIISTKIVENSYPTLNKILIVLTLNIMFFGLIRFIWIIIPKFREITRNINTGKNVFVKSQIEQGKFGKLAWFLGIYRTVFFFLQAASMILVFEGALLTRTAIKLFQNQQAYAFFILVSFAIFSIAAGSIWLVRNWSTIDLIPFTDYLFIYIQNLLETEEDEKRLNLYLEKLTEKMADVPDKGFSSKFPDLATRCAKSYFSIFLTLSFIPKHIKKDYGLKISQYLINNKHCELPIIAMQLDSYLKENQLKNYNAIIDVLKAKYDLTKFTLGDYWKEVGITKMDKIWRLVSTHFPHALKLLSFIFFIILIAVAKWAGIDIGNYLTNLFQ